mgnify:CR=1 FL=1
MGFIDMCSTPKPKRKVKAKTTNDSVGILSAMSSEKRKCFAKRANLASERRVEIEKLKQENLKCVNDLKTNHIKKNNKAKTNTTQSWLYWLFNTSISDIMRSLVRSLVR